jgi:hypothetical protein
MSSPTCARTWRASARTRPLASPLQAPGSTRQHPAAHTTRCGEHHACTSAVWLQSRCHARCTLPCVAATAVRMSSVPPHRRRTRPHTLLGCRRPAAGSRGRPAASRPTGAPRRAARPAAARCRGVRRPSARGRPRRTPPGWRRGHTAAPPWPSTRRRPRPGRPQALASRQAWPWDSALPPGRQQQQQQQQPRARQALVSGVCTHRTLPAPAWSCCTLVQPATAARLLLPCQILQ